jgi:hypothetical protein
LEVYGRYAYARKLRRHNLAWSNMTTQPAVEPAGETSLASHAHTVAAYTLSLSLLCIGSGMLLGIFRLLAGNGSEHVWGKLDAGLILQLLATIILCGAVFRHLAHKHAGDYLLLGFPVALLTGTANAGFAAISAPTGTPFSGWLLGISVAFAVLLMLLAGFLFGTIKRKRVLLEGNEGLPDTAERVPLGPPSAMAKCGAVPFAVLTLGIFYSSFLSLGVLANKASDTAALEFSLSMVLHLVVATGFIYLTWRTYRRPTILLVSVALAIVAVDFVSNVLLAGIGVNFIAVYWTQMIAGIFGVVGLRGVLVARRLRVRSVSATE